MYFGHFPSRERGRPGTPGASEELLGVPSRSVGETAAARTVTPAAPEKTRRVGRVIPPILPSSAAGPARILRKFAVGAPGSTAWPPRSRARAPQGRGRSELRRCLRSPTPLAARRLQRPLALPRRPCPGRLGNTHWKKISGGFLARGRAECREAQTLPGRRDCPGRGRSRSPDRLTLPTAWQFGRLSSEVTVALTALPPPTSGTLPLLRSRCPTRELLTQTRGSGKSSKQQQEENLFLRPPPSFYKPREPAFPRATGRLRPHPGRRAPQHLPGEILCLCLKLVRGQTLQTEPLSGAARKGSPPPLQAWAAAAKTAAAAQPRELRGGGEMVESMCVS